MKSTALISSGPRQTSPEDSDPRVCQKLARKGESQESLAFELLLVQQGCLQNVVYLLNRVVWMQLDHELFQRLFVLGWDVACDYTSAQERLGVFPNEFPFKTGIKDADLGLSKTSSEILTHANMFLIVRVIHGVRLERI